jgi:hypothetical protein
MVSRTLLSATTRRDSPLGPQGSFENEKGRKALSRPRPKLHTKQIGRSRRTGRSIIPSYGRRLRSGPSRGVTAWRNCVPLPSFGTALSLLEDRRPGTDFLMSLVVYALNQDRQQKRRRIFEKSFTPARALPLRRRAVGRRWRSLRIARREAGRGSRSCSRLWRPRRWPHGCGRTGTPAVCAAR